jgi:hypothetical protein
MHPSHSRTAALRVACDDSSHIFRPREEDKQTPRQIRKTTMLNVIDMLKEAARNYALYVKTRNEIANLPLDIALDLDIYPGDAEQIAHDAVYRKAA